MAFSEKIRKIVIPHQAILSAILLFGMPARTYLQNYHLQEFNTQQGLSQPYVYTMVQDNRGYLWIGTGNGLSRYDGYNFKTYTVNDSLADNFITSSFKSKNGIWFGHMSGDLSFYSDKTFSKSIIPVENKTMITDIEEGPKNSVWAGSYSNGFLLINNKQEITPVTVFDSTLLIISAFKFIDENEILVGSINGLSVWEYRKPATVKYIEQIKGIPETRITDIIRIKNQETYLVATQDEGIYKVVTKTGKGFEVTRMKADAGLDITGIQSLLLDSDSGLWAGTFGEGLYKFDILQTGKLGNPVHFNKEQGFFADYVKVVFEDREGIIWSGNYGKGLTKITRKLYAYSFYDENTTGNNILSICTDNDYRWLGTEKGLLKVDRKTGRQEKFYDRQYGLPDDAITAILQTGKILWLGTSGNGLFIFDPVTESARSYYLSDGNLENYITSVAGDKDRIWVGTKKGVCKIEVSTDSLKWFTIMKGGLPHNSVNDIFLDSQGRVWVTTLCNTLAVIEKDEVRKIPVIVENGNFRLNSVAEDGKGRIWVGTLGNGIFVIGNDRLTNLTVNEGLLSDYCYSVISDHHNSLWVGHKGGVSRIHPGDFTVKAIQQEFEITESYDFNKNAIALDNKGTVWLGFNKGLLSFNRLEKNTSSISPLLNITSIRVNDNEIEIKDKIRLAPGRYKISLEFTGISLSEPELTKYQYFLKGYDDAPAVTKNTKITYPGLPDGKYTFYISAMNGDGVATESPLRISFHILTPLWKLPWFYGLVVALVFLSVIWIIHRREKITRLEKIRLEQKIRERTVEIVTQKNELEIQHKLINEKNKEITDSIIYASRIQEAIIPPIELVNKLLPESFIINKPRDIVSGDFYWVAERNDKTIFAVADCTGHGVPGAFMSVLGNILLNEIVYDKKIILPDKILNRLRDEVIRSLRQNPGNSPSFDSINMSVCSLDIEKMELQFSGALSPLVFIHKGELQLYKSDRYPLGISPHTDVSYTLYTIPLEKGDMIYQYTDGFQDQFGGIRDKRFTSRQLHKVLLKYCSLSVNDQKEMIEKTYSDWMKGNEQTDDMLMLGVQV